MILEGNNWSSLKLKTYVLQKTMSEDVENKPQTGRKHLQSIYLKKNLYPRYIKNSQNSLIKKIQFLKMGKRFE